MDFRPAVLLSAQRALWDVVTPNLRSAAVEIGDSRATLRFVFENEPDDEDLENLSLAETYMIADFGDDVTIDSRAAWTPMGSPRELLPGEYWVFYRKEE